MHADNLLVVVDKPSGMLSIPGRGSDKQDCVITRVREKFPSATGSMIVHRLDMDTSGLLLVALDPMTQADLGRQFEKRTVHKRYEALLAGIVPAGDGAWSRVELAFRLDPDDRPRQVYDPTRGKIGITEWRHLHFDGNQTRIELRPLTGRTHQLRVHAAHRLGLGMPIVGDRLYGTAATGERLCLHATELGFVHPGTGVEMRFVSPAPF